MRVVFLIMIISVLGLNAQNNSNNLTIYNGGFSLVKKATEFDLKKGANNLVFRDFSEQIEINSLNLSINAKQLEKSYVNIIPDVFSILRKYIGKNIKLMGDYRIIEGILQSIDNGIIIKTNDNKFAIINDIMKYNIYLDEMLIDLEKKKEFVFVVESEQAKKEKAQFTYLTNGLGWNTEYLAYIDKNSKKMNLEAWINLQNNTGIDFENTSVKFIAGNLEKREKVYSRRTFEDAGAMNNALSPSFETNVEAKQFGDLYSYPYPRKITLLKNELKQLPLIYKQDISVNNKYNYSSNSYNNEEVNVDVIVELKNDDKNGLGIPLPAGNVKIFKEDDDAYELIGANNINHTAKGETLRIKIGSAFDLIGKSETLESKRVADKVYEYVREITLKNRKDEAVEIDVVAELQKGYEIISSDEKYTPENAYRIKLLVKIDKNSEKKFKIKYRVNNYY